MIVSNGWAVMLARGGSGIQTMPRNFHMERHRRAAMVRDESNNYYETNYLQAEGLSSLKRMHHFNEEVQMTLTHRGVFLIRSTVSRESSNNPDRDPSSRLQLKLHVLFSGTRCLTVLKKVQQHPPVQNNHNRRRRPQSDRHLAPEG